MRRLGIIAFSIMAQGLWASESGVERKEEKRQSLRHYPSHDRREIRVKSLVLKDVMIARASDFKNRPRDLLLNKTKTALVDKKIPLESPQLTQEIHRLKTIYPYKSGLFEPTQTRSSPSSEQYVRRSSSSAQVAALELDLSECGYVAEEDLTPRRARNVPKPVVSEPCCASSCIIL